MKYDIVIVGGGLAGLAFACALKESRLKIALVEGRAPSRPEGWDARIYAISPANARFLADIGVWKHLDDGRMAPVRAMEVYGDGDSCLDFSAYQSGVSELAWILESSLMAQELWENVKRQGNVDILCPATPRELEIRADATLLHLEDGRSLAARLLVGADGRESWVRNRAGFAAHYSPYGEKGVVANFSTEKPHGGIAYQWFRDDGVLAYLPLPGNRISIVWSTPDTHADALAALPAEELCARVAAAGNHTLGRLELLTPAAAFALKLMRVPEPTAPRLALIGDAAHGIHPLSGHGINLGYRDAKTLAEIIAAAAPWQDIGDARLLARYRRARKEEVMLLQTTTDGLRRLFREDLPGLKPLRNLGLNLVNRLGPVKSALVRYALES
jgi:ubiquinone biosynthesis UbiH/UbiF/VisC/COQ6 family hydroxylase